jgi:tRNA(Ile)-lysidine synthase
VSKKHQRNKGINSSVGVHKLNHNLRLSPPCKTIFIAYSGGLDSHVLLHLCASDEKLKTKLTAVYINHGLQQEAESWGRHCETVCRNLDVSFLSFKVNAQARPGESPEEAARNARYAAFKSLLNQDDVLLTAHHAEDQLETVLLHLFRGGGLRGLSGIPASLPFGKGRVIRPLLDVPKAQILAYANHHKLVLIEDPSNLDSKFDRNFLRNQLIPMIKTRWPALDATVSRSARHCADAGELLATIAEEGLTEVANVEDNALNLKRLRGYSSLQQDLIVRCWFQRHGLKPPSEKLLQQILVNVIGANADAAPLVKTQGRMLRRYRDKLYLLSAASTVIPDQISWPGGQMALQIGDECYEAISGSAGIPLEIWQTAEKIVKFRAGGESITLPGRQGRHSLKNLFQEKAIPPWERSRIPLIYLDNRLAAVGGYWISAEFYSEVGQNNIRIVRQISAKDHDDTANVD